MAHGLFGYFNFTLKDGELTGDYINNQSAGSHREIGILQMGNLIICMMEHILLGTQIQMDKKQQHLLLIR